MADVVRPHRPSRPAQQATDAPVLPLRGEGISTSGSPSAAPATDSVTPTVGDRMRAAATTVEPRAHLAAAAYLMKRRGDSALVVTTDGDTRVPLGLITESDITQAVADGRDLERVRIGDLLTGRAITVTPDTPAPEALGVMVERRIHHLPVVSNGGLVGIVDMTDLCRALMSTSPPWASAASADRIAPPPARP
jgi:CBS domain-containing protein